MKELIRIEEVNGEAVVSSRVIADKLGKQHKHVIEKIKKVLDESILRPIYFKDSMNRKQTEYLLDKDAFILLVMNYEGHNDFKRAYIQRFNEMENKIKNNTVDYEAIGKMIGMAVTAALMPIVDRLDKIGTNPTLQIEQPKQNYYSLMGYCSFNKISVSFSELKKMGMDLRKLTLTKNMEIRKIPDERWGFVNSYPVEILDDYFTV